MGTLSPISLDDFFVFVLEPILEIPESPKMSREQIIKGRDYSMPGIPDNCKLEKILLIFAHKLLEIFEPGMLNHDSIFDSE